jgi:hypothetical protein
VKTCSKCGQSKSDNKFRADGRRSDNLSDLCYDCEAEKKTAEVEYQEVSNRPWSEIKESDYADAAAFCRASLIDENTGSEKTKALCKLPVYEPGGALNRAAVHAAAAVLAGGRGGVSASAASKASAARKLRGLYRRLKEEPPDSLKSMAELETENLDGVEILASGGPFRGSGSATGGDYYSSTDLEAIANANNELADEVRPVNKVGHSSKQRLLRNSGFVDDDEQPAAGWLHNFRVKDGKLLADVKAVPKKLSQLIREGAFRTRSVELRRMVSQKTQKEYEAVVTGLAWLGAKAPAVRTLDDIHALYEDLEPDEEGVRTVDYHVGDAEGVIQFEEGGAVKGTREMTLYPGEVVLSALDVGRIAEIEVDRILAARNLVRPADTRVMPELTLKPEEATELAKALGVEGDADLTAEQVLAKAKELAEARTPEPPKEPPEDDKTRKLSEDEYEQLRRDADSGRAAAEKLHKSERDALLVEAIKDGKMKPADREFWEKQYDEAPDRTREIVEKMNPEDRTQVHGSDDDGLSESERTEEDRQFAEFADLLDIPRDERAGLREKSE